MVDYALNDEFDIYRNESGDFVTVSGREEFEQNLALKLYTEFSDLVGLQERNAREKIRLVVTRVARQEDEIENIAELSVSEPSDKAGVIRVEIGYRTGETFQAEL